MIKNFIRNEDGATAIEYGLIAALVGVAIIASLKALTVSFNDMMSYIVSVLTTR